MNILGVYILEIIERV